MVKNEENDCLFKVGDRVISKNHPGVIGRVKEVLSDGITIIEVLRSGDPFWVFEDTFWQTVNNLEFYETPIQRMKRLYSET